MNQQIIKNTSNTGIQKTLSTRGGQNIFQQWIHIHNVRMRWLGICAKDIFVKYTVLNKDIPVDKKVLIKALEESAEGISLLLSSSWDDAGKVKGFKKGVIRLLGYFIEHESDHCGDIIILL